MIVMRMFGWARADVLIYDGDENVCEGEARGHATTRFLRCAKAATRMSARKVMKFFEAGNETDAQNGFGGWS